MKACERLHAVRHLYALMRCPICHAKASTSLGCCQACAHELFQVKRSSGLITLGTYNGKLERAIKAMKFYGATRLAKLFAEHLQKEVRKAGWQGTICPVPLHWTRLALRGYNQAALIAKPLAHQLSYPYHKCLSRKKRTQQQAKLSRQARLGNVEDAFVAKELSGKTFILVDDVITSGATTEACKQTLLKAGAASVKCVCVARAVYA